MTILSYFHLRVGRWYLSLSLTGRPTQVNTTDKRPMRSSEREGEWGCYEYAGGGREGEGEGVDIVIR